MTTATFDLDLDQQRCEQQAAIAEEFFISGEGDGFDGVYPASSDLAYPSSVIFRIKQVVNEQFCPEA